MRLHRFGDGRLEAIVAEDVGRHNAVDKVSGEAMLRGIRATRKILAATGRMSSGMLRQAVHLGTAIVVSRTSATSLCVELAKRLGLTLTGSVRGDTFYVYSHPERFLVSEPAGALHP